MVKESILNQIRFFIDGIEHIIGKLSFAMAIPNTIGDENSSVTLFLAADWIENKSKKETLISIFSILNAQFSGKPASVISRVTLISLCDPMIKLITPAIQVKDGRMLALNKCRIGNLDLEELYLFVSIPQNSPSE